MTVAITNSILAADGSNITINNDGENRLLAIITLGIINDYVTPNCAVSVGGQAATQFQIVRNQVGQRAPHIHVAYIKHAQYPANGARALSSVWTGGAMESNQSVLLELTGVDQTTPLSAMVSANGTASGSPHSLAAVLSNAVGKFVALFGAFTGGSYTDSSGYINSVQGHTFQKSTMPASEPWPISRMSVFTVASVAATPQTFTIESSLRGEVNSGHAMERLITGLFVVNEVPGPLLAAVTGSQGADIVADGEQNFTYRVQNIPVGEVPKTARIGSVAGVGGTNLGGLTYATTANAGEFIGIIDMVSGIVSGTTSVASELTITHGAP